MASIPPYFGVDPESKAQGYENRLAQAANIRQKSSNALLGITAYGCTNRADWQL